MIIILSSLALALLGSFGFSLFFPAPVAFILAFILGLFARRIVEKLLGFTLEQELSDD